MDAGQGHRRRQEERRQAHADLLQAHIGGLAQPRQHGSKAPRRTSAPKKSYRPALHWLDGWQLFEIPAEVYADWNAKGSGAKAEAAWNEKPAATRQALPEQAAEFTRRMAGDLPANFGETADEHRLRRPRRRCYRGQPGQPAGSGRPDSPCPNCWRLCRPDRAPT